MQHAAIVPEHAHRQRIHHYRETRKFQAARADVKARAISTRRQMA